VFYDIHIERGTSKDRGRARRDEFKHVEHGWDSWREDCENSLMRGRGAQSGHP
jgi:hypothetical protein